MKKLISVIICLLMVLSLLPFTVSAADEIDFTLRIKEETDNELTLTLDYDGGTGFSALDIDITFDRIRLELKSCTKGEGYTAFEKYLDEQNAASISSINSNGNPVKVSMANTLGFKSVNGKKSVVTLKFAKVPGTKFAKEDVTLEFTNCQTSSFTDIKVNFDYDLAAPAVSDVEDTSNGATDYPQQPSADNIEGDESGEIGNAVEQEEQSSQEQNGAESQSDDNGTDSSNAKTVIVIIAVAVCAVGIAAVVIFKVKGKQKND